ncbi:alcohol dehydrogenase [Kordiimonas sediminis]|uniref:Alcohol dehydrogenase 2 n=1 Tax=Kordiimonas sediminis TaxID=1735581 RepID=A0A919E9A9_9PROT|nr:iron-containing alcohol dehydrogenase [Kordiimonas sediminis]GHF30811.1 alcohol dehydrogenase [Kordiimonas sediminis]
MSRIALPRILEIGGGSIDRLPNVLASLGLSKPLLVTDPFMVTQPGCDRVLENLPSGTPVYSDTVTDPTSDIIEIGTTILQEGNFDSIVAFGGGSSMDTAKAMSIVAANGGHIRDYKAPNPIPKAGLPVIAVPTTAGTGSEATMVTVVTDTASDEKMMIKGLPALPLAAIVDFEFTYTVPFRTTADTGIDSLCHAIEAYTSKLASPFTDSFALSAMKRISAHLKTACYEPLDPIARSQMMLAATEAGIAFSNASVTLTHGMSRPIGAHFHVPHGLSNAMLLPAVTKFSIDNAQERFADCARAMDLTQTNCNDEACDILVRTLIDQNTELKVPTPKAYGIDEEKYHAAIPLMAQQAIASGSPGNNPRVPSASEIEELYKEIWD